MKILIDIMHPAQFHLFKYVISELNKKGHETLLTIRDKDIIVKLLDDYGIKYKIISKQKKGLINLFLELVERDLKLFFISKKFNPDILISSGPSTAHIARLLKKTNITYMDTEHSWEQYLLIAPFTDFICTPSCFYKNLGKKQIRYKGYHELAYLHPDRFKPDPNVLREIGLSLKDTFFVIRFVSWNASHDIGKKGISEQGKEKIIAALEKYGKIFITSESDLPDKFQKYKIKISPTKIHDLLYYAAMYIGEGGTMASEAAVLGTPSIYVNPLRLGYLEELENKYGLLSSFKDEMLAYEKIIEFLNIKDLKERWQKKRMAFLNDKIDVTAWIVDFIEKKFASTNLPLNF